MWRYVTEIIERKKEIKLRNKMKNRRRLSVSRKQLPKTNDVWFRFLFRTEQWWVKKTQQISKAAFEKRNWTMPEQQGQQ